MTKNTKQELKTLLKKLTDTYAISAYEKRIIPIIKQELKRHVSSMEIGNMGSLIVKKGRG